MRSLRLTHIGGPTVLAEVDGLRILTDPTFDPPGLDPDTRQQVLALVGALWYHELVEWVKGRRDIRDVEASLERAARFLLRD